MMEDALLSKEPIKALRQLKDEKILERILPELAESVGFQQCHPKHHLDVFEHTMEVVRGTPPDLVLRWAALLHDVAKPKCMTLDENGIGHFYGHDRESAEIARNILLRLDYTEDFVMRVSYLIRYHMVRLHIHTEKAVRRIIGKLGVEDTQRLIQLFRADKAAHRNTSEDMEKTEFERIFEKIEES